jgi:dTDP-4-amino-4,6-dideoxygalactose transaminase
MRHISFNCPYAVGREIDYIRQAIDNMHLCGDGPFTKKCQAWLEARVGCSKALLTHSCTGALEMAAMLADIQPGDEVIMPSYTFVSTANAFVLRGGVPVFVDICPDTLNLDAAQIEAAITPRTKAIVPVHYAGVGCEMDTIMALAHKYDLLVIEDAAHGVMAAYKGHPLGSIGHLGAFSFHETKNLISGEGGALLINDVQWAERAEIIREKGTNRSQFFRGQVDKYTWVDIGSSYLPSEIIAAFLWAQLEQAESLTQRRLAIWDRYHEAFAELEEQRKVQRPVVPTECRHNAHMYYLLLPDLEGRTVVIETLKAAGIQAVFHYIPLHSAPAGGKYGRAHGDLAQTQEMSNRLVRLPLWIGMSEEDVMRVVAGLYEALKVVKTAAVG